MDTLLHEQGGYHPYLIFKPKSPAAVAQGIASRRRGAGGLPPGGVINGYVGAERDHAPPPPGVSPLALTPTPYIIGAQKFLKF